MNSAFNLSENVERGEDNAPHFSGQAVLDGTVYEAAAWLGTTKKCDPYLSVSLSPKGERNGQKISFAVWQKKNRQADVDPHFRVTQTILDVPYSVAATLAQDPTSNLFSVRLEFGPIDATELPPAARARHDELQLAFSLFHPGPVKDAPVKRPAAPASPPPAPKPQQSVFSRAAARPKDPDLDAEPDDIPF
jgi:uncharacterized protein (DUF736 family)